MKTSRGKRDEENNHSNDDKMDGDAPGMARLTKSSSASLDKSSGVLYLEDGDEATDYTVCCFWRPQWARRLLSPVFFLVCICLVVFGDAAYVGAFAGIITTIETRYRLSVSNLGVPVTAYNTGSMVALPFVSYFGGRRGTSRPRWIGAGTVVMALGTFITALPQFMFGKYDAVPSSSDQVDQLVCAADNATGDARCSSYQTVSAQNDAAFWIMICGSVINGVGYAAIPTISLSYIDDNCRTETTAMYAGIINSMYGVGGMFGFFISAYSLTYWVDFYRVNPDDTALLSQDAWVGAWWMGLLVCSALFVLACLPLFGFPRRLPERYRKGSRDAESPDGKRTRLTELGSDCEDIGSETRQTGFLVTYFRLMCNPVLMFITLGSALQYAVLYGFGIFFAKYLELQFEVTASVADLLTGVVIIPAYGVGWIMGGYIVRRTRMGYSKMFLFATGVIAVGLAEFIPMFFLGCNNPQIAGVAVGYEGQSMSDISLVADCNSNCGCTAATYQPVCDVANDVIYFSPCFAGCNGTVDNMLYSNCSCLVGSTDTAVAGLCDSHCGTLVPYLVLHAIQILAITMAGAPQLILILKFVDPADKTAALGINYLLKGLGSLVGPMMYATFFDLTCLVWQSECEEYGSCQIYNIQQNRNVILGVSLTAGVLGLLGTCPAYYFIRRTLRQRAERAQLQGGDLYVALNDTKKVKDTDN